MADLYCPGCAGTLPDCFCRSGSTAGTFSNRSDWPKYISEDAIRQVVERISAMEPTLPMPVRCVVTEYLPTPEGKHWNYFAETLFISREARDALVRGFQHEIADGLAALMSEPDDDNSPTPKPEL